MTELNYYKDEKISDLQRFVLIYNSFGIDIETEKTPDGNYIIELSAKAGENRLVGHFSIFTEVWFDENGKFIKQVFSEY